MLKILEREIQTIEREFGDDNDNSNELSKTVVIILILIKKHNVVRNGK